MTTEKTRIEEPSILTANTYYWNANASAGGRRSNEKKRLFEVENFFKKIGLVAVGNDGSKVWGRTRKNAKINLEVEFSYSESCNNVYKHLTVLKDGKGSNIKSLRKLYQ